MPKRSKEALVAQVEFEGKPFRRTLDPEVGEATKQERSVRIVSGTKKRTGETFFLPADECPIVPSDFPHLPLSEADKLHDYADVPGSQLTTIRKHGASQPGVKTDQIIRKRGGDPKHRPRKTGGFLLKSTPHEIEKERRRKKRLR